MAKFIYAGGGTTKKVFQYDPSDMSKVAESLTYGGTIRSLTYDGTYIYAGGYATTKKVFQYDPSDMSKVAESLTYGGTIYALTWGSEAVTYIAKLSYYPHILPR